MPGFDDVPLATTVGNTDLFPVLQGGTSKAISGANLKAAMPSGPGGGITGNEVDAPDTDTVGWLVNAASNSPAAQLQEGRLPDNSLVYALGTSYDDDCEGFASVVNALPVHVWDGGTQDPEDLTEVPGMAPGDMMFYVVEE